MTLVSPGGLSNGLLIQCAKMASVIILIISMTKLLDADWLRGVQLFH